MWNNATVTTVKKILPILQAALGSKIQHNLSWKEPLEASFPIPLARPTWMSLLGFVQSSFAYLQGRRFPHLSRSLFQYLVHLWKLCSSSLIGISHAAVSACWFSFYHHVPWRRVCLCILCNLPLRWLNHIKVSILHSASDTKTAQAQLSRFLINCALQLPPTSTAPNWTYISLCPCPSCTREHRTEQQYFRQSHRCWTEKKKQLPQPACYSPVNPAEKASHCLPLVEGCTAA